MSNVSRCPACGAFVQQEDQFCWSCGHRAKSPTPAPGKRPSRPPDFDEEIGILLRRAFLAQRRGDLGQAERLVREALESKPDSIPALSMLSEILRAKGDQVGAVEASQRASQAAAGDATPGALRRAREERAYIEQEVIRQMLAESDSKDVLRSVLSQYPRAWYQSSPFFLLLAAFGLASLLLALISAFDGHLLGYLWFAISLSTAGWTYHDADVQRRPPFFWGSFVLCLGPFGLAIYFLVQY